MEKESGGRQEGGGEAGRRKKERNEAAPKGGRAGTAPDPAVLQPIGLFESCFLERHGTPRQGLLVPSSRGKLTLCRCSPL